MFYDFEKIGCVNFRVAFTFLAMITIVVLLRTAKLIYVPSFSFEVCFGFVQFAD